MTREAAQRILLGILGATGGAVLGCLAFLWIAKQGFYAMVLPGALTGLGAGLAARIRSRTLTATSALMGLGAGVISEWRFAPFTRDASLGYFLRNLGELRGFTWLMMLAGAALAAWLSYVRRDTHRGE